MMTCRLRRAFPRLSIIGVLALQPAAASANCDWYVKAALEQQQRNATMKCGFSGSEWSVNKAVHAAWCAGVAPDVSRSAAQKRQAALDQCAEKSH